MGQEPQHVPDYYTHGDVPLEANLIWCRDEKKWTPIEEWADCEPYCELCGSHAGMYHVSDDCMEIYDFIWDGIRWK